MGTTVQSHLQLWLRMVSKLQKWNRTFQSWATSFALTNRRKRRSTSLNEITAEIADGPRLVFSVSSLFFHALTACLGYCSSRILVCCTLLCIVLETFVLQTYVLRFQVPHNLLRSFWFSELMWYVLHDCFLHSQLAWRVPSAFSSQVCFCALPPFHIWSICYLSPFDILSA